MILILLSLIASDPCRVAVIKQQSVVQQFSAGHSATVGAYSFDPYHVQRSAFVYSVPDTEKQSLQLQNQRLTDELIEQLRTQRSEIQSLRQNGFQTLTQQPDALAIIRANCMKCHDMSAPKGGFAIAEKPNLAARTLINDVVAKSEMPPGGKGLSDEEREIIAQWSAATREELKEAAKVVAK